VPHPNVGRRTFNIGIYRTSPAQTQAMFLLCSDRHRDGRGSEQVGGDPANAGYADLDARALGRGHSCIPNNGLKVETELERLSTGSADRVDDRLGPSPATTLNFAEPSLWRAPPIQISGYSRKLASRERGLRRRRKLNQRRNLREAV